MNAILELAGLTVRIDGPEPRTLVHGVDVAIAPGNVSGSSASRGRGSRSPRSPCSGCSLIRSSRADQRA